MENRPWFVVRVLRIFLDRPVYGERSVFCSVRAVAHQRGEEDHGHKHGHGHGHHEKDARRDTNKTPPVCCCEPTHSAPKSRIAWAPDLVDVIYIFQIVLIPVMV